MVSKKFFRQVLIARAIPLYPRKYTSVQIQSQLASESVWASLRTIQRDLGEMSEMDFFGIVCDQRSKPHGWSRIQVKEFYFGGGIPLSLAVAIRIWSTVTNNILPPSIEDELRPLLKHADIVLSRSPSMDEKTKRMISEIRKEIPVMKKDYIEVWQNS